MNVNGVDLGTAFASIACQTGQKLEPKCLLPVNLPGLNPMEGMPTDAYIEDDGEILVYSPEKGSAAKYIRRNPARAVHEVKTWLTRNAVPMPDVGETITPLNVYAAGCRDLVQLAHLQCKRDGDEPSNRLVFAYPAAFEDYPDGVTLLNKMQEAIESVTVGGEHIKVIDRIPEPAAGAFNYLHYRQYLAPPDQRLAAKELTVTVVDIGHGTTDVAIVTAGGDYQSYQVWETTGLADVGGRDFDRCLMHEVQTRLHKDHGYDVRDEVEAEELRLACVQAKHELSEPDAYETIIRHQSRADGSYFEIDITRDRFEEITRHLMMQILEVVQKATGHQMDRGRKPDEIILTGGGSQMPMVKKTLEHLEPQFPTRVFQPFNSVAYGAAIYGRARMEAESHPKKSAAGTAQFFTRHAYGIIPDGVGCIDEDVEWLLQPEVGLPAEAQGKEHSYPAGRQNIRVYKPRPDGKVSGNPEECDNMAWLHFDLPKSGRYSTRLSVTPDYNLSVALYDSDGKLVQNRSLGVN